MASGSHMCNGIIADFPMPPMKISTKAQVSTDAPMKVAPAVEPRTSEGFSVSTLKSKLLV